jgi:16S rRNA (guanine966-N2)-methyltransferase
VLTVAVDRSRQLVDALRATGQALGAEGLETLCSPARAFLAGEARAFDVIFLDPPFDDDPWPWLLPACAPRLAPGGYVYAEARSRLVPPPPLAAWRSDKAGQVHYHLFAREPSC